MKLVTTGPVDIAIRTLADARRRRVYAWFDALRNWNNDPHVRKSSHAMPDRDVYVLTTSDGLRIFFHKGADTITVLDIATKETIDQFAETE